MDPLCSERKPYAHTFEGVGPEGWQPLDDHLRNVAALASGFADAFGYARWGYALGILHDGGKVSPEFQARLFGGAGKSFDHAELGAVMAEESFQSQATICGQLMAYAIAGHHGGMPNGIREDGATRTSLKKRLEKPLGANDEDSFLKLLKDSGLKLPADGELEEIPLVKMGRSADRDPNRAIFSTTLLTRMLFSCLVDADYLDTEAFMTPVMAQARRESVSKHSTLTELLDRLDNHMKALSSKAELSPVNNARAQVFDACVAASSKDRGIFTLTVPTGGGKTLSSLAFALRHAISHGMTRIIYAIPFTSIVEQTADVFREVLGDENVLEHHSNYDFEDLGDKERIRERLAVQNWDAPVIVTTNVQLLESLYANKPAKCRKLHNIVNSVIVLDEAQSLPDGLLTPSLAALEDLALDFNSSVVLCTATQPALIGRWPFGSKAREIVPFQNELERAFGHRTAFEFHGSVDFESLATVLAQCGQVLCVVGTKAKARAMYEEVAACLRADSDTSGLDALDGLFHLSTNMTPLHRSAHIAEIRRRLGNRERVHDRCIVISTQLIEAGVDIDFPVVYREVAGVDSLVQAAGRCNRNGGPKMGIVHVFKFKDEQRFSKTRSATALGTTWLDAMKALAERVIDRHGGVIDAATIRDFFEERYGTAGSKGLDQKEIYKKLTSCDLPRSKFQAIDFEDYARDFRIIDNNDMPVFVPWGTDGLRLMDELRVSRKKGVAPAAMVMRLQRSTVSVPAWRFMDLQRAGYVDSVTFEPINVLTIEQNNGSCYSDEVGILWPGEEEAKMLII